MATKKSISKRFLIILICMVLWLGFGMFGAQKEVPFTHMMVYFASLILFISTYLFGESVRKSSKTTLFTKGQNSKREIVSYSSILLWAIAGGLAIQFKYDLVGLSGYFEMLAPFIGAYIIGETYKPSGKTK